MCASCLAMLCLLAAPYRAADDKGTTPALRPDVAVVGEGGANAPRRFALVVGIDRYGDYSSLGNLRGCVADAQAISKVLVERCGYAADHVVALTDTQFRVPIQQRIKSLFQGLKPEDVVLFYFSGHGMRGVDGQDYLVPLDGEPNDPSHTMLSTQDVRELLRKSGAGQILMVMDCCRNTADGRAASTKGFGERSVAAEKDAKDLVVFQSCGPDEVSHELPDSNRGAYSLYLEEGLSGQADANGDGLVTVAELQTYVRDHVSDWARQHKTIQVPAISLTDVGDPIRTAGIVVARVAPRGRDLPSVTLTDQNVKDWIASTKDPKVKAVLDKMKPAETPGADAMGEAKKAIESAAANAELDNAVKVHGFKDAKEWAAVTMKVMAGIMPAMQKMAEAQMPAARKGSPEYQKMKTQMDDEIAKSKQVFGQLSPEEQKVVEHGFASLSQAMGESKAGKPE